MANPNTPYGLAQLGRTLAGGCPEILHFIKATADVVYPGDAVNQLAGGTIEADSATPGTTLYTGISLGFGAAAAANISIPVIVSPDIIFHIQASAAFAVANSGLNANLVLTAGDATLTRSKHAMDTTTINVNAARDIKLRRLYPEVGNEAGNYAKVEASWNRHRNFGGQAGV
jgi:hypothetical protein